MKYHSLSFYFLYIIALAHIAIGLTIPVLVTIGLFDPYLNDINGAPSLLPSREVSLQKALISLFGPTIASWGLLFLIIVKSGIENMSRYSYFLLLSSLIAWAGYDSLISQLAGININIVINTIVLTLMLIPLLALRPRGNHFNQEER